MTIDRIYLIIFPLTKLLICLQILQNGSLNQVVHKCAVEFGKVDHDFNSCLFTAKRTAFRLDLTPYEFHMCVFCE